jgi:hypothetical protein
MTHEEAFTRAERAGVDGAFTLVDGQHPVGIYLGLEAGQRAVMIVCPEQPPEAPSLSAIQVNSRHRQGGDWALVLRLEQRDLRLLFARLVEDLEEATRARPERPGEVVIERLLRWQRLLARRRGERLDDRALRGLAAELCFLLDEAIPTTGADSATLAWRGPYSAPRDFVWPSVEVEVKAVHKSQREVTVSSLEQLSDTGVPIFLWCKTVELASERDAGAVTAAALVARARAEVSVSGAAADRLEDALRTAGYEDHEEYGRRFLRLGEDLCHAVMEPFPRIQRQAVAPGVVDGSYQVRLADLKPFIVPSWGKERTGVR